MECHSDDDMLDELCLILSVMGFEHKELRTRYFTLSKGGSQPRNTSFLTNYVLTISILLKRRGLLREKNQDDAWILAAIFFLPPNVHIIRVDSAQWRVSYQMCYKLLANRSQMTANESFMLREEESIFPNRWQERSRKKARVQVGRFAPSLSENSLRLDLVKTDYRSNTQSSARIDGFREILY